MWCRCCKKKTLDDDDRIIKQSPLICEDIETPTDSKKKTVQSPHHPSSSKNGNYKAEKEPSNVELSPTLSREHPSERKTKKNSGHHEDSRTMIKKDDNNSGKVAAETSIQPQKTSNDVENCKIEPLLDKIDASEDKSLETKPTAEIEVMDEGVTLDEGSPELSPEHAESPAHVACRIQNPFFDQPIDLSDRTVADLDDPTLCQEIISKMEDALELYKAVAEQGLEGFERIYEDKKNETGHELFIYGRAINSNKGSKIQVVKQSFKIKYKPEEFIFVSNDPETQNRINQNISLYETLFTKKAENYTLELVHMKSKKILMIDSRQSLFLKYCKKFTDKRIVSIAKSVLLKDMAMEKKDLVTNIQLTVFDYTYCDTDPSNPFTQVNVFNSTDFRSSVGLTLLKPVITKSVKELLKKNSEEIGTLRDKGDAEKIQLFAPKPQ